VNRKVGIIASLAALGLMAYMGGRLIADPNGSSSPSAPPSRPKTAIAVFNLSNVMENCEHAKAFIEDSKAEAKSLQNQIEPMLKDFEALKKKLAALPEQKRDAYKDEYEKQERAIQDFEKKGRESIKKKSDQQIKILYKEIEDAVVRLAKYRQIDLVMHYNDFVDEMKDQPANIRQKFMNAPLFPMYSAPGIDITKDILTMLNQRSAAATKSPAGH